MASGFTLGKSGVDKSYRISDSIRRCEPMHFGIACEPRKLFFCIYARRGMQKMILWQSQRPIPVYFCQCRRETRPAQTILITQPGGGAHALQHVTIAGHMP